MYKDLIEVCGDLRNVNPILNSFISHVISIQSGPSGMLIDRKLLRAVCKVFDVIINVALQFGKSFNNHLTNEFIQF